MSSGNFAQLKPGCGGKQIQAKLRRSGFLDPRDLGQKRHNWSRDAVYYNDIFQNECFGALWLNDAHPS